MNQIKDKALAVVAFAAFYRLESGNVVTSLVASDGTGIKPMPDIAGLVEAGLAGEQDTGCTVPIQRR